MDAVAKEQWALALLTARFDCAQQKFFQAEYGRRRRSPAVALALCLTLGAFGAHEFYLGRLRSAALRLLFCWTLIPLVVALLEASFVTRRVRAYNFAMARTLAEIVDETYAAVRAQAVIGEQVAVGEQEAWRVGAARTFVAAAPTRWAHEAPPTTPLAEEREAPAIATQRLEDVALAEPPTTDATPATPATPAPDAIAIRARSTVPLVAAEPVPSLRMIAPTHPLDLPTVLEIAHKQRDRRDELLVAATEPLAEPTFSRLPSLSQRERLRLGPSLDALLAGLTSLAEEAEARRTSQEIAAPLPAARPDDAPISLLAQEPALAQVIPLEPESIEPESIEPEPMRHEAASPTPEAAAPTSLVGFGAAASGAEYAKMMATDEPAPAIMGAGPAVAVSTATPDTTPAARSQRVQRIVVRKLALVDGRVIAEARATRDVVLCGSDDEETARIAAATDEARAEAMRALAALVPSETLAQANLAGATA